MANDKKKVKMAVIVGAAQALKLKARTGMSDDEVIQQLNRDIESIIFNLDTKE